jgi:hypothetical protein
VSPVRRAALALALLSACNPRVTTLAVYDAGPGVGGDAGLGAAGDAGDGGLGAAGDASVGRYIEAESGNLSGPFLVGSDATASGGHFIYANAGATFDTAPGSARAAYDLVADTSGTYQIWGRIHDQDLSSNRFWFQIDGGPWVLWRITTGDVWFWSYFHDNLQYSTRYTVALSAGTHQLVIANSTDNAGLDRLYYALNENPPEGSETMCNPPHSVQLQGVCNPSCGSLNGRCTADPCDAGPFATYDCGACCTSAP